MPPPYNSIARVRIHGVHHAGITNNVLHFGTETVGYDAGTIMAQLGQLATAVVDCVRTTLLPALGSDWKLDKVTAQALHPVLTDPAEVVGLNTDVGALANTNVSFTSQLVSLRTGLGGRSKRGRMFLPPAPEGGVTESTLTDAQMILLVAFVTCIAGKFLAGGSDPNGWRLCVLSRKLLAANANNYNLGVTEVTNMTARKELASMRTRKLGRGA